MQTFLNVLLVILVIAVIALAVLYFLGRRLEKRQVEQQQLLEMSKQTVSMLVIDKKKMKIKDSGLPKIVYEQTPKYMRWAKVPVVKAKVGPKVMTLMADERVFASLPVKTEAKAVFTSPRSRVSAAEQSRRHQRKKVSLRDLKKKIKLRQKEETDGQIRLSLLF